MKKKGMAAAGLALAGLALACLAGCASRRAGGGFTGSVNVLSEYALGLPGLPPNANGFVQKTLVFEDGVLVSVKDNGNRIL